MCHGWSTSDRWDRLQHESSTGPATLQREIQLQTGTGAAGDFKCPLFHRMNLYLVMDLNRTDTGHQTLPQRLGVLSYSPH